MFINAEGKPVLFRHVQCGLYLLTIHVDARVRVVAELLECNGMPCIREVEEHASPRIELH